MARARSKSNATSDPQSQSRLRQLGDRFWAFAEIVFDYIDDLGAVLLASLGAVTAMGLFGLTTGKLIGPWVDFIVRWLGWGSFAVPILFITLAIWLYRRRQGAGIAIPWARFVAVEVCYFAALGLLAIADGLDLTRAELGEGGGILGWGIATLFGDLLGALGRTVALLLAAAIAGGYGLRDLFTALKRVADRLGLDAQSQAGLEPSPWIGTVEPSQDLEAARKTISPGRGKQRLPREYRKNFHLPERIPDGTPPTLRRDERLPPLDLLEDDQAYKVTSREINLKAGLIEKTLADFGLPVHVVDFRTGPSVTQFAVEPGYIEQSTPDGSIRRQKVRVSQISALANDLALALSSSSLRIEAPVPGKSYIGVEVPNQHAALVRLKPMIESDAFQTVGSPLAVCLGRDVAGAPVFADLAALPHLLIAGTTGSGKSVCITALATCLMVNNPPEDLNMVMIDPKMVELIRFNGVPHLLGKVETELERIVGVLRWCTVEMDRRYRLLEEASARDIEAYNRRMRRRRGAQTVPRIVVVIDELADLMMLAPDQTERTLVRLAQMARATGIHLVMATQRPSTDIVTGLIKANFPGRISFAVASNVDSRVILDAPGAETLLGRGDLLYLAPDVPTPVRLQGVIVSDTEVERLVDYWKRAYASGGERRAPWDELLARQAALGERDEILERAIELVRSSGEASASMLQRRLRIGYPRAARLMDELEELGVIGEPQSGGRSREVLIGEEDDPPIEVGE